MANLQINFKVTSFRLNETHIMACVSGEDTETDVMIGREAFEDWLTEGASFIIWSVDSYNPENGHTHLEGKTTVEDYWDFAKEVNNEDAIAHLQDFLTSSDKWICKAQSEIKEQIVIDMLTEKGLMVNPFQDTDLRVAILNYGNACFTQGVRTFSSNLQKTA